MYICILYPLMNRTSFFATPRTMNSSFDFETLCLDPSEESLRILDQSLLPGTIQYLSLTTQDEIIEAIVSLKVRGAPAIGIATAFALYLGMKPFREKAFSDFYAAFQKISARLAGARPTAVNLFGSIERIEKIIVDHRKENPAEILGAIRSEAFLIQEEDESMCREIGLNGLSLLKPGWGILTHCNAGRLATSSYGTALAPIYLGQEQGYHFRVFADETRPLLQGARLTAFELLRAGVDTTVICDNMASVVMEKGLIQAILVGCDRVAGNGDMANKIGTNTLAILAGYYGIPFYVCAPSSTIDPGCKTGTEIIIEEREPGEVTEKWYRERMAPEKVKVFNPAFDVTDHTLITAFITEKGVISPPFHFEK